MSDTPRTDALRELLKQPCVCGPVTFHDEFCPWVNGEAVAVRAHEELEREMESNLTVVRFAILELYFIARHYLNTTELTDFATKHPWLEIAFQDRPRQAAGTVASVPSLDVIMRRLLTRMPFPTSARIAIEAHEQIETEFIKLTEANELLVQECVRLRESLATYAQLRATYAQLSTIPVPCPECADSNPANCSVIPKHPNDPAHPGSMNYGG